MTSLSSRCTLQFWLFRQAMAMCKNMSTDEKKLAFIVSEDVHPQTIAVVKTRAAGLGIKVNTILAAVDGC
jgi:glycine cleavage system pyridoxal-binding protein P